MCEREINKHIYTSYSKTIGEKHMVKETKMDYTRESNAIYLLQQVYESFSTFTKRLEEHARFGEHNLTARQFLALTTIDQMPSGEATMSSVAAKLKTTKQNISKLLPKLESKGFIFRVPGNKYKKSSVIMVTELGRQKRLEYASKVTGMSTDLFKEFSEEELDTLLYLLRKLR